MILLLLFFSRAFMSDIGEIIRLLVLRSCTNDNAQMCDLVIFLKSAWLLRLTRRRSFVLA